MTAMFDLRQEKTRGRKGAPAYPTSPTNQHDEEEGINSSTHAVKKDFVKRGPPSIPPSWVHLSSSPAKSSSNIHDRYSYKNLLSSPPQHRSPHCDDCHADKNKNKNNTTNNFKTLQQNQKDIAIILQVILQEIKTMKTANEKQTIKLERDRSKLSHLEKNVLDTLKRVNKMEHGSDEGIGYVGHSDDTGHSQTSYRKLFTRTSSEVVSLPTTPLERVEDETTALRIESSSSNEKKEDDKKSSPTLESLSCFFRLLFACLFLPMASEYDPYCMGVSTWNIISLLCPCSLLLSFIFSGVQESFQCIPEFGLSAIIGLFGWFINLLGAIIFIIAISTIKDYMYDTDEEEYQEINPILRMAFGFLAAGHALELQYAFFKMIRLKKKIVLILLAILPPTFALAAYIILPLMVNVYEYVEFIASLLIVHALARYVHMFCCNSTMATVTSLDKADHQEDTFEEDEKTRLSNAEKAPEPESLPDDTLDSFSLMMVSNDAKTWNFSFLIFFIQASLSIMILAEQIFSSNHNDQNVPLGVPTFVPFSVSFSQFWALLLAIFWQSDILTSVQILGILWYRNGNWPYEKIHAKNRKFWTWFDKVMLPNLLRLTGGLLALGTSFVIIVKSEDTVDLFKDLTALILISKISNVAFRLSKRGYFGKRLKNETEKINEIRLVDNSRAHRICRLPVRPLILLIAIFAMFGGWSYIIYGQYSRRFFLMEYPNCDIINNQLHHIGDGYCKKEYNTPECNYDGDDCIQFNKDYPYCDVLYPPRIGDGTCYKVYNTTECGYDGGDCLEISS